MQEIHQKSTKSLHKFYEHPFAINCKKLCRYRDKYSYILEHKVIPQLKECDRVCLGIVEPFLFSLKMGVRDDHCLQHLTYLADVGIKRPSGFPACLLLKEALIPQTGWNQQNKQSQLDGGVGEGVLP